MSNALYNLAAMTVASTGTGTITLGSAATINGVTYLSFASAGVPNGGTVYYSINDVGQSEVGYGTYTSSGTTLTRNVTNSTNSNSAINMTAAAIVRITPGTSQFREILIAARTYYVRTDGSDSNTGLADTAAGAFLTIQKAVDTVFNLDINTQAVTIQVRTGTFGGCIVTGPWLGSGVVSLVGDTTTPSNCVISSTTANCVLVQNGGKLTISGFKLTTTGSGLSGLNALSGGNITVSDKMEYGACVSAHMRASISSSVSADSTTYTISGAAAFHILSSTCSTVSTQTCTVTVSGTPAFGSVFCFCISTASVFANGTTYSGAATGTRYSVTLNGSISVGGGGANFFPGNAAGSTATGGQYN